MNRYPPAIFGILVGCTLVFGAPQAVAADICGHACLESIGKAYMNAYLHHNPKLAAIARDVKYTEDNVPLNLPDGTWETVTRQVGPVLEMSDPKTGEIGIFTPFKEAEL